MNLAVLPIGVLRVLAVIPIVVVAWLPLTLRGDELAAVNAPAVVPTMEEPLAPEPALAASLPDQSERSLAPVSPSDAQVALEPTAPWLPTSLLGDRPLAALLPSAVLLGGGHARAGGPPDYDLLRADVGGADARAAGARGPAGAL